MTPEVKLLRSFLIVAEEANFTRAAVRLHIAQPALSTQIQLLERQLGVRLLDRTTRSVRLTEAGRAVQERGPAALAGLDDVWEAARRAARGELGDLRLAYGASTGYGTVPSLVEAARAGHPGLRIAADLLPTPAIAAAVREARADAGIARAPEAAPGVRMLPLRSERYGVLMAATHPLVSHAPGPVPLAAVADHPLAVHPRDANPGHYDQLTGMFRRVGATPALVERSVSFDPTQRLLRDARTVALVGEGAADGLADWLRWLPLPSDLPALVTRLVLPLEPRTSAAGTRFAALALDHARAYGWL
ncbi:LysR family transcriptional regulator [Streptomyces sp. NBC_01190]|uniref:LysR family transcriptional regulator n=1 Tax=Streptomyces sp. NBC_01190 TaxID=2903767 RepID=UPI00386BF413|nr:LysR family transcriptional regulator [Streptomyces sp. NBC_01190]